MATVVGMVLMAVAAVEPPAFSAGNDELRAYLVEAAENHPGIRARYEEWRAALQREPQARALDDPMFTYGQFIQSDLNRVRFAIRQKFPWFGTRRDRGDTALAEANTALARFYAERNRVFSELKQGYADYAFLAERVRITAAELDVVQYIEEVAQTNYSLGDAAQNDVLRILIERAELEDDLARFEDMRSVLSARLAEILGRDAAALLPWPEEHPAPSDVPAVEQAEVLLAASNPELAELDALLEQRAGQIELARKKRFPDFTLGLDYVSVSKPRQIRPDRPYPSALQGARRLLSGGSPTPLANAIDLYAVAAADEPMAYSDGGDDNIAVSLTVNVPIWRKKIKAGIAEARHREAAAQQSRERKLLALKTQLNTACFAANDALRRRVLYRETLIPTADQTYRNLLGEYAAGGPGADFMDLMESLRTVMRFQLEEARAVRDLHAAAAQLEALIGGPYSASSPDTKGGEAAAVKAE